MWVAFATHIFFSKNINVFAMFDDRSFNAAILNKWALILVYEEHSMAAKDPKRLKADSE